ncbi:SIS domain-containing protein [Salmonella enterica subsp. salamae]|nr:RpiR family transcriptional regulator [Salmonella enterica subsp. salamae]EAM3921653.1 SIS domain-containing protein [Salmonella enterica]EBP3808130.1 SIS domain-containing protein [Salmonella enterica subsp. enterica]EDX4959832.1 SIS domain-containing protein [Salmonella enterica subsp. salamae serovar 58:l,z13,z28:z6]EAN9124565.1 SIS domain-containing protein [Salmonella enterica]
MHSRLNGNEVFLLAKTLAPELGKKERAIARFIHDNPQTLSNMSITDIAHYLKVSVSSITKVSKKLGFIGFHDLKLSISNNINNYENTVDIPVIPDSEGFIEKIFESTLLNSILALQEALNVIDCTIIKSVAWLFINKNAEAKIFIAGCGGSASICDDFNHKLLKIGIFSTVFSDSHKQLMSASLMRPGDILLAVSHSGQTSDLIQMVNIANERGAETICLTNYPNSPLSLICRYSIISAVKNNPITGENATTRIVHLNILDAIFTIIASKTSEIAKNSLLSTRNAVISKRTVS